MRPLSSVGGRLALALLLVVAGVLAIVYLIVVPSYRRSLENQELRSLSRALENVALPKFPAEFPLRLQYVNAMAPQGALEEPSKYKDTKGTVVIVGPDAPVGKKISGQRFGVQNFAVFDWRATIDTKIPHALTRLHAIRRDIRQLRHRRTGNFIDAILLQHIAQREHMLRPFDSWRLHLRSARL